jgi:putative ABC transport system permease protein
MMLLSVAWRNVWRNKLRSGIVLGAIALGLFGGVFSVAFMEGMAVERIRSAIALEVSHVQIHRPEFLREDDIRSTFQAAPALSTARAVPGVRAASARVESFAMAQTAETASGVTVLGISPGAERRVSRIEDQIIEGSFFGEQVRHPIVIGLELADKLGAGMRSRVVLTLQSYDSTITGGLFLVAGIFRTSNSVFDETTVFVQRKELSEFAGIPEGALRTQ